MPALGDIPQLFNKIRSYPSVSVALAVQASLTKLPGFAILKAQLILAMHQHSFLFCVPM